MQTSSAKHLQSKHSHNQDTKKLNNHAIKLLTYDKLNQKKLKPGLWAFFKFMPSSNEMDQACSTAPSSLHIYSEIWKLHFSCYL